MASVSPTSSYAFLLIHYLSLSFHFQTHSLLLQKLWYVCSSAWNSHLLTLHMAESFSFSPPLLKWPFLILHPAHYSLSQHLLISFIACTMLYNYFIYWLTYFRLSLLVKYNRTSLFQGPSLFLFNIKSLAHIEYVIYDRLKNIC